MSHIKDSNKTVSLISKNEDDESVHAVFSVVLSEALSVC